MDSIYSQSLLISLIAGGLGTSISALLAAQAIQARKLRARLAVAALVCGATALFLGTISIMVHLIFGHGPDSVAPMTTLEFFVRHKAYWVVPIFILLACSGWHLARRHDDRNRRSG